MQAEPTTLGHKLAIWYGEFDRAEKRIERVKEIIGVGKISGAVGVNPHISPQTEEAINHAKAAGVSIVVAINKIDLDDADVEKVKGDLASKDLNPEDWGGNIQMVPISALNGEGVDKLLEAVLLESELLELKANYDGQAQGVVIESELDKFRGPVATLLIQNGTLKTGDMLVCGSSVGKVKSIIIDY